MNLLSSIGHLVLADGGLELVAQHALLQPIAQVCFGQRVLVEQLL